MLNQSNNLEIQDNSDDYSAFCLILETLEKSHSSLYDSQTRFLDVLVALRVAS